MLKALSALFSLLNKIGEYFANKQLIDAGGAKQREADAKEAESHVQQAQAAVGIPDAARDDETCVVCGGLLTNAIDPVSGKQVKAHIYDAREDAALLTQTLSRWAQVALGDLTQSLPTSLQRELSADLPAHPCDLIRKAFPEGFGGSGDLTAQMDQILTKLNEPGFGQGQVIPPDLFQNMSLSPELMKMLSDSLEIGRAHV